MTQDYITLPSGLQYRREWEQTDGAIDMRNPKTLKRYTELQDEKYHIDCYKYDCFYAFGQKQFDEYKKRIRPLREGDQPIFVLQSPYGPLGAVPATEGEETNVDLEMLFNATLQNPEAINRLFTASK